MLKVAVKLFPIDAMRTVCDVADCVLNLIFDKHLWLEICLQKNKITIFAGDLRCFDAFKNVRISLEVGKSIPNDFWFSRDSYAHC